MVKPTFQSFFSLPCFWQASSTLPKPYPGAARREHHHVARYGSERLPHFSSLEIAIDVTAAYRCCSQFFKAAKLCAQGMDAICNRHPYHADEEQWTWQRYTDPLF